MARDKELDLIFGKKLKLIRKTYGKIKPEYKKQTEFAKFILDSEQDVLSKYENGRLQIPLSLILKLTKIKLNLNWFFNVDDLDNPANVFLSGDDEMQNFSYLDFINDETLLELNTLLLKLPDDERKWLTDYLSGRIKKSEQENKKSV